MRRDTWLDQIVYRFQHQWETNPQYRAAATGVIGLVVVLTMCSAMLLLSTTANSALAAIGLGTGSSSAPTGTPNTGTNNVNGFLKFQTPVVTYPAQTPPVVATIPDSQTPLPGPTATDTPAPTDTPTGGGGNYACSGSQNGISYNVAPCPATAGQGVTISLSVPGYGRHQGIASVGFDPAGGHSDCTWLFQPPSNGITLNSAGNWSASGTIGADCGGGTMPLTISVSIVNGPSGLFYAPPVQ